MAVFDFTYSATTSLTNKKSHINDTFRPTHSGVNKPYLVIYVYIMLEAYPNTVLSKTMSTRYILQNL